MRRQQSTDGFNKEKLAFLVASFIFAAGTYQFLSTGPVALEVGKPISTQPGPAPTKDLNAAHPLAENFYVVPGTKTRMIDPLTGQLVNRNRKSPFTRADWVSAAPEVAAKKVNLAPPPPPPPPPPPAEKGDDEKRRKEFGPHDAQAEVEFVGVMMMSGKTYGMIKPRDGGPPKQVKVGDKIPDYDYTVTKIEKQAIWIVDEQKRPFLLKDDQFIAVKPEKTDADMDAEFDADDGDKKPAPKSKAAEPAAPVAPVNQAAAPAAPAAPAAVAEEKKAAPKGPAEHLDAAQALLKQVIAAEKDPIKRSKLEAKLKSMEKQRQPRPGAPRPAAK